MHGSIYLDISFKLSYVHVYDCTDFAVAFHMKMYPFNVFIELKQYITVCYNMYAYRMHSHVILESGYLHCHRACMHHIDES